MKSTGDGNCLFHSASIALVGNEDISNNLRLFATLHAVLHLDHYMTKVNIDHCVHLVLTTTYYDL